MKEDNEKKESSAEPKKDEEPQTSDMEAGTSQKENKELEPVISPEEFEKLEKKEEKNKALGFLNNFKKDKPASADDSKPGSAHELEKKLNNTLLKVEKLEGKFEMMTSSKSDATERLSRLAEEIGELRSMIFSREDTYSNIESEFEKIKESTAHMKPEKIQREIEEHTAEVMKVQAQQELQKSRIDQQGKLIQKTEKILGKFKSYENMLDISKQIRKQTEKINDSEKYTARMAAKTEKIFAELDERLSEFQKYKKEIDDINEMLKDLVKSTDSLEIKTDSLMSKDSFSKIKQESDDKLSELDTRIKILKDIVSALIDKISTHGVNISSDDLSAVRSEIHEDILRELEKSVPYDIDKKIKSLDTLNDNLDTKLRQIDAQVFKLQEKLESKKDISEMSPMHQEKDEFIAQINNLTPPQININPAQKLEQAPVIHNDRNKQLEQDAARPPPVQNIPKPFEEEPRSVPEQERPEYSYPQKHIEKVKNLFKRINPKPAQVPAKTTELPQPPVHNNIHEPIQHPQQTESESLKETLKKSIEQNKKQGTDIKSEIQRLKALYKERENLLEKEKESGKDIFKEQLLLDNASLDLGMAELDLLDGNEATSRQKIEKVSAILESI
ncbi:MAG: hypothetical protein U9Q92_05480 [archaeon]|nr:hypothetical protein [archaeon]